MTDDTKPDDTDGPIAEDRTIDQQIELGEIDAELDPWLADNAVDYTGRECPRCGKRLYGSSRNVITEHNRRYKQRTKAPRDVACYCLPCGIERKRIVDERSQYALTDFSDSTGDQGGVGG